MARSANPGFGDAVETSAMLVGVMFVAGCIELTVFPGLLALGIVPRTVHGLIGVAFSPLLHANAAHLFANATPLFVLLIVLFSDRRYKPGLTLMIIWVASGLGTWLIGRSGAIHLGASSIIYGLVAYLVAAGFWMQSWRSAFIAMLVLLFYGGIIWGVVPQRGPISWEAHLSGLISGIWAAQQGVAPKAR